MKILLVVPYQDIEPYILPNLGLGYLASALRNEGHEVNYLDCLKESVNATKWRRFLKDSDYELIGIQMYSYSYYSVKEMFRIAKEVLPNIITVVGGPHPNALTRETLVENPEIDYAIHGEGERSLVKLANILEQCDYNNKTSIPNLAWRNDGRVIVNERIYIEDLDDISFPAWDLMDPRKYPMLSHGLLNRTFPIAPIFATRGCPYACTFCSARINMGSKVRKRSPSNIVAEIEMLVKEYGVREIHFEDDNFTFSKDFACEVCQLIIDRRINIYWACPNGVRLDSLDADLLKLMETSGCYSLALGIESGSDRVLRMMKKGLTSNQVRRKIRLIREITKIRTTGFVIFGYPGENKEDLKETEDLILNEPLDRISVGPLLPYPRTEIYETLVKENKLPGDFNWKLFGSYAEDTFVEGAISKRGLLREARLIHLKFYLRLRIISKILSEIHSFRQFKIALKMFLFWFGVLKINKC